MSTPPSFRPFSLADLRALEVPPRDDLIEELLPVGQVTLFSAREKSGKTLLATDVACAIALEQPFLDRAVRSGCAIFIALEENIREVRARILTRVGLGVDDATVPLYVLPANGSDDLAFRLDDEASVAAFAGMVQELDARLAVIDTMREAHGLRENESDDMAALVRPLRQIAHATNCAILLIHHMSRAGNSRGSTAIAAAADQLWEFRRTDRDGEPAGGNPAGTLVVEGRFGPPVLLRIKLGAGLRWEIDDSIPPVDDASARGAILACLRERPSGLTAAEIADATERRLKTIQNELSRMLRETPALVIAVGIPTRHNPRRFRLVDSAPPPDDKSNSASTKDPPDCSRDSANDCGGQRQIVPDSQPLGGREGRNDVSGPSPVGSYRSGNDGSDVGNGAERSVPDAHPCSIREGRNDRDSGEYTEVVF